jgi:hydrogenase expression/formation protein HypC
MCLAIPVQIVAILPDQWVEAVIGGVTSKVCCALIEAVQVGDYIIVHAGFAIARLDVEEAEITLALFAEIAAHLKGSRNALSHGIS